MSKKLIAVAAAAALALTGLVAVPAGATAISNVTIYHGGNTAGQQLTAGHTDSDSAVSASTFAAARNVVFNTSLTNATTRTAVRFDVNTAAAASAINITATGGVRMIATIASTTKVTDGVQALNGSTVAGALTYTFYAWNTSSTAGTVKVDTGSSAMTFYVKGVTGPGYNIATPVWPTSLPQSSNDKKVTFTVTDAYGNAVSSNQEAPAIGVLGGTAPAPTYNSTSKLWESTVTVSATATSVALQLSVAAVDLSSNGFAAPANVAFTTVASGSLSAQVTALTAQVAALTATVTALTDEYNKLATRFNKRVTLKKAPTKKVVLK
jgi:hypothetical protein